MPAQKFYEGQEFHNPNDPAAPVLVYRAGKFLPKDGGGGAAPKPTPQDATYLDTLRSEAARSLDTATQAERFLAINKEHPTGGLAGAPWGIGGVTRDLRAAKDPEWAAMEGITSAVAPSMRPPGSGSSSDKDTEMYTRGFLNTRVPLEANRATYDRLHKESDHDAAHAAFIDSWYQHKGTLLGGEQAFSQYWAKRSGGPSDAGMTIDLGGGKKATVRAR